MPLQISEIGVHLAVGGAGPSGGGSGGAGPAGPGNSSTGGGLSEAEREEMVQACVDEVLRALRLAEAR